MAVKIDRHGQAAILSPSEIELVFAKGLESGSQSNLVGSLSLHSGLHR
jgi:hypothetical protein